MNIVYRKCGDLSNGSLLPSTRRSQHHNFSQKAKKERFFMRSFGDPYENRTRVTAVKGRCLNLLTNGPYMVAAVGFEPTTCRV